jgi:hypothetical protein
VNRFVSCWSELIRKQLLILILIYREKCIALVLIMMRCETMAHLYVVHQHWICPLHYTLYTGIELLIECCFGESHQVWTADVMQIVWMCVKKFGYSMIRTTHIQMKINRKLTLQTMFCIWRLIWCSNEVILNHLTYILIYLAYILIHLAYILINLFIY